MLKLAWLVSSAIKLCRYASRSLLAAVEELAEELLCVLEDDCDKACASKSSKLLLTAELLAWELADERPLVCPTEEASC